MTNDVLHRTLYINLYFIPDVKMKRYFIVSINLFSVPTLVLWILLPIRSIQSVLWFTTFLVFVIGDSVTISLIKRYENLRESGPATGFICGRNPSSVCAFGTRILFFTLSLLVYLVVTQVGIGAQFEMVMLTAIMLPLALTVGGSIVFLNSIYHIFTQELSKQSTSA